MLLSFWGFAQAQPLTELEATPSILSEPQAYLRIQEVSFKNKEADWVSMVYRSPSDKPINLKGISFADDRVFKTIEEDFILASDQEILLTFKSEEVDTMPYLYSSRSGLTGTTEQFIIYDQDKTTILDAVCWASSKPTEGEIQEQKEIFEQEGWHSSDITSCIPSESVKTNESIQRHSFIDTNSAQDWLAPEILETPPVQTVHIPESTEEAQIESSQPLTSPEKVQVITPTSSTETKQASSSSQKSASTSYQNGDLSTAIIISEVLPNPDGTDSKKEWIELTNTGDNSVNLGNWTLDDSEDGSKPYTLPSSLTLQAGTAALIMSADSKLSLGNKEDSIRLFDHQGTLIDEVLYEEAPSAQSYSRISIEHEDGTIEEQWIWTNEQTPEQPNPSFRQFTAEVTSEPSFDQTYTFTVRDQNDQEQTITFDEELIAGPLARATFTIGSTLLLTVEPTDNRLQQFEVLATAKQTSPFPPFVIPSVLGIIAVAAGTSFFLVHKKFPWQEESKKL